MDFTDALLIIVILFLWMIIEYAAQIYTFLIHFVATKQDTGDELDNELDDDGDEWAQEDRKRENEERKKEWDWLVSNFSKNEARIGRLLIYVFLCSFVIIASFIAWRYFIEKEVLWAGIVLLVVIFLMPIVTSNAFAKLYEYLFGYEYERARAWIIGILLGAFFLYIFAAMAYDQYLLRQEEESQQSSSEEITQDGN